MLYCQLCSAGWGAVTRGQAAHLSSPAAEMPWVIHVGISQRTDLCMSSSEEQPHILVNSPGCPDLHVWHASG